jgi:hypothetical protein
VILPLGTRAVLRVPIAGTRSAYPVGAVETIWQSPADMTHAYRVRLPGGFEATVSRDELVVLADAKQPVPDANRHWSLFGVPEQPEDDAWNAPDHV